MCFTAKKMRTRRFRGGMAVYPPLEGVDRRLIFSPGCRGRTHLTAQIMCRFRGGTPRFIVVDPTHRRPLLLKERGALLQSSFKIADILKSQFVISRWFVLLFSWRSSFHCGGCISPLRCKGRGGIAEELIFLSAV